MPDPRPELNLKTVVEVFIPTVAYPTGGFSYQALHLSRIAYAAVMEGPTGYLGLATSASGNAVRVEVYWDGGSGVAFQEIGNTGSIVSGRNIKLLLMGN